MAESKKAGKPSSVKAAGEKKREAEAAKHAREARAEAKAHKGEAKPAEPSEPAPAPAAEAPAAPAGPHKARPQPKLTPEQEQALGARRAKNAARPAFRRHEWWRYKKLGGKHAAWRVPRGIHSKVRRHFGYRPPLVSIGYRGPAEVRGLHPSGFEEVLVHNVADLAALDKETQAARVGGTVGGRKAKLIEAEADKRGIRILNRRAA